MRRVAVTGGRGFVGSHLVREFLDAGIEVVSIDVRVPRRRPPRAGLDQVVASHADLDRLTGLFAGADAVCHLSIDANSPDRRIEPHEASLGGVHNVCRAAIEAGVRRLVYFSSIQVYGWVDPDSVFDPEYLPVDEAHPTHPANPYGEAKLLGEAAVLGHGDQLEVVVIRPGQVTRHREAARWWRNGGGECSSGRPASYVDVRDLAAAGRCAVECPITGPVVLNVVADDSTVGRGSRRSGRSPRVASHDCSSPLTNALAKETLGWQPVRTWRRPAGVDVVRATVEAVGRRVRP